MTARRRRRNMSDFTDMWQDIESVLLGDSHSGDQRYPAPACAPAVDAPPAPAPALPGAAATSAADGHKYGAGAGEYLDYGYHHLHHHHHHHYHFGQAAAAAAAAAAAHSAVKSEPHSQCEEAPAGPPEYGFHGVGVGVGVGVGAPYLGLLDAKHAALEAKQPPAGYHPLAAYHGYQAQDAASPDYNGTMTIVQASSQDSRGRRILILTHLLVQVFKFMLH
ncbi:zinc finger protein ZIC 3-like [Schistocerca serialis cubense]|uniref:zinc finger protein ZIC 3-like n=1 Tax=Schistocerca serialis cubense TaxID=2023355 RepID=UPI00214E7047|nr:zinc finger protein ZIC 3-like [Schistocerca serialis cubense]